MKLATKIILSILVIFGIFLWIEVARSPNDDNVHIYFLDVGQGDSILIGKNDYQILIDGGPDDKVLSEIARVMPARDRKIEKVILSHPHADHIIGLNEIIDRYEIGTIYSSGVLANSNQYLELLQKIKDKNIDFQVPEIGKSITSYDDFNIQFLWPGDKYKNKEIDNLNNSSEVLKACYFSHCSLFLGDQEVDEQKEMFTGLDKLKIDYSAELMKVSHHGSANGTDQFLLEKIMPKFAVISVGANNNYGHPANSTINLLKDKNIKTFRTDKEGTVEFILSKEGIAEKE